MHFSDSFRRIRATLLLATSVLAFASPATAQTKVGAANQVRNIVSGSLPNRQLRANDAVFASEAVSAGANSHGELLLNDDSRVLVGENSVVQLDNFVVDAGGFKSGTLKVARGAFRFITGNSAKGTFKVATPLATIGVRGTAFDVYVDPGTAAGIGETYLVILDGEAIVCAIGGACLATQRRCDIIRVPTRANVERAPFFLSAARSAQASRQFNLLWGQQRFDPRWRVPTLACSARAAQEAQDRRGGHRNSPNDNDVPSPPEPDDCGGYGC